MSAFSHQGVVYFAACGEYVKIGYSSGCLEKRLSHLFGGRLIRPSGLDSRQPVHLLRTIPGCIIRDERRIHGLFAPHHDVGEWYRLSLPFLRQMHALEFITEREICVRFRRARAELKRARARTFLADTA